VNGFKDAAARSVNKPVSNDKRLHKLVEGGFNRVPELTMEDGTSIIARLPYPSTSPRRLAVVSEVAPMDFVRAHGIPTPRILGYSIDENAVGSEYIWKSCPDGQLETLGSTYLNKREYRSCMTWSSSRLSCSTLYYQLVVAFTTQTTSTLTLER